MSETTCMSGWLGRKRARSFNRPPAHAGGFGLEVEANAEANLAWAECASSYQKRVEKRLPLFGRRGRCEGVEVDELTTEAEDGFVQHIVKLHHRPHTNLFSETKFTSDIQIEEELSRTLAGIARQVSRLADSRQCKETEYRRIDWVARAAPVKQFRIAREDWSIVADVIKVAVGAADGDVEGGAGCQTKDWRDAQIAELARHIKRSGENKAMPPVKQAARAFAGKVAGYERVGGVYNSVVSQMRKCVSAAE